MKEIKGLRDRIVGIGGKELLNEDKPITKGDFIAGMLFNAESLSPKDTLRITRKILPMIVATKNTLQLEDGDFEIMKKIVETTPHRSPVGIWGQILEVFENAEDKKTK